MRIGNSYLQPYVALEESAARREAGKLKPASEPLQNTTDLIAMSSGIRFDSPLASATEARNSRVEQLAAAWREGIYRPDAKRVADKLMGWGFETGEVSQ